MRKFVIVTTCKGRLQHIQASAPLITRAIEDAPNFEWLVVDYDCPDNTIGWLREHHPEVFVAKVDNAPVFHKPSALNIGGAAAFGELKANYVLFMDADTLLVRGSEFVEWIEDNASPDTFLIYPSDLSTKDLTGFLVLSRKAFIDCQGYDAAFQGWGGEDIELRLRLYLKHHYFFDEIPVRFLNSIDHGDELRTAFYQEKDALLSNERQLDYMCRRIYDWLGRNLGELFQRQDGHLIRRLLGTMPDLPLHFAGGSAERQNVG